ncbi:hypothetical protein AVEN_157294-1 [Araneus ventricosus]|uniref:Integrase p58-like C-terminal domain-containing protein n=1 Tax=Araneus ventricosus TaxID=182803 RepID=A0A4Y2TLT1_ARAVE|nr:hypothetical protein AVEN_157294-1 [Araneus ventricosus]
MKNLEARLESVHAFARERIKVASESMNIRYDSRATDHYCKEGDLVWTYNPKRWRGLSPKLQQNWEEPYTIVKKLNDVVHRVQRSSNAKPNPSILIGLLHTGPLITVLCNETAAKHSL